MRECDDAMTKAKNSIDPDYYDSVADNESGVIENLFGAAFVVCQAEITAVVSNSMRLHETVKAQGHNLTVSDGTKNGILRIGSFIVSGTSYSYAQAINASANYFKHFEEWDKPWAKLPKREKLTIDIISACGAKEFSSGNLYTCAAALGVTDFTQLEPLANHVSVWAKAVRTGYERELKQRNLL